MEARDGRAFEPLIIGHRGAPGYRPEHTRASYDLAIAQGADAVEPDLVASRDGVLLLRHENDMSATTDVASRPDFAPLRRTKEVDGRTVTGWFTEDFTWAQLSTLRAVERLPALRPGSAAFDGSFPLMRFAELLSLLRDSTREKPPGLVVELKQANHFASMGLPLDELLERELDLNAQAGPLPGPLVIESFERSVLNGLQQRGVAAKYVYLIRDPGTAFDLFSGSGTPRLNSEEYLAGERPAATAPPLPEGRGVAGLDGISVSKTMILDPSADGHGNLVGRARAAGLEIFCWTFRPENAFLSPRHRVGPSASFGDWRSELQELIEAGVDGIFVDHPDLARSSASSAAAGA